MSAIKKRKLSSREDAAAERVAPPRHKFSKADLANDAGSDSTSDDPAGPDSQPAETKKSFEDLGVIDSLCESCAQLGFKAPTPIQAESIPLVLQGRDVIGLAETGSGKTAAFTLPILQALMEKPQPLFGLILAPTRELAYQISQQVEALGAIIGVRCAVIVGGMDMVSQSIALGKKPHVVVATPGRLMDHLENTKGFSLRNLKYLVMDEADRLLDLDFGPILNKILKVLPPGGAAGSGRHTLLFSATMTDKVESLQRASLYNPVRVSTTDTSIPGTTNPQTASLATVRTLLQSFVFIPHKHKDVYLVYLLSASALAGHPTIVFARTVAETQRLTHLLRALGLGAIALHGQLQQSARLGVLNAFRSQRRPILLATDLAARGLDLPAVDAVINFDLPADSKTYVHRVGRTARAGRSGRAVSLVCQYDVEVWMRVERSLGKKVDEMQIEKGEVMALGERVGQAQRVAISKVKADREKKESRGKKRKGGSKREDMDVDEE